MRFRTVMSYYQPGALLLAFSCGVALADWVGVGDGIDYQAFQAAGPNNLFVARMARSNTNAFIDTSIAHDMMAGATEIVRSQAARLPFTNNRFSYILARLATQLQGDMVRALRELSRVLAPGGQGVVDDYHPFGL